MAEHKEIQEGKIFAGLAYISILCIIPLLFKKDNKFAYYHGKQGLVIFIGEVILMMLVWIPILGWMLAPIGSLIFLVLSIIGIVQALAGNYWQCPVVSELAAKMNI